MGHVLSKGHRAVEHFRRYYSHLMASPAADAFSASPESASQDSAQFLCETFSNDCLSIAASYLDIFSAGRFDCCSKSFLSSGFMWQHLYAVSASPIPAVALKRLTQHHDGLRAISCKTVEDMKNALPFLGQLEHIHLDVSDATTAFTPTVLSKLRPEKLKSLHIHCWDYSKRKALYDSPTSALPALLVQLTHFKLISEPNDQIKFLKLASLHCKALRQFHFESERFSAQGSEASQYFNEIIKNNREHIQFVDLHVLGSSWETLFPTLSLKRMAPAGENGWTWEDLDTECQNRYGVPFERFGRHSPHTFRGGVRDAFYVLANTSGGLTAQQIATEWSMFQRYYHEQTLHIYLEAAGTSLKELNGMLRNPAPALLDEMLEFLKRCISIARLEQLGKIVALFMTTARNSNFFDFFRTWTLTSPHKELICCIIMKKMFKMRGVHAVVKNILLDQEWRHKIGLNLRTVLTVEQDFKTIKEPLAVLLAVKKCGFMPQLILSTDFDPFGIKAASGRSLFDEYFAHYLIAGTHGSDVEYKDLDALIRFSLTIGKISERDVEQMMRQVLETCRPRNGETFPFHDPWLRMVFAGAFIDHLPRHKFEAELTRHYAEVLGAQLLPEDFEAARTDNEMTIGLSSIITLATSLLWRDTLRKLPLKFLNDPDALKARLHILKFHHLFYPKFVNNFIEEKKAFPVPGVFENATEAELEQVRQRLSEACNQAGIRPSFRFAF